MALALMLATPAAATMAQQPAANAPQLRPYAAQYPSASLSSAPAVPTMRPVPREGSRIPTPTATPNPTRDGWNLQWRKSPEVTPVQPSEVPPQANAVPAASGVAVQQVSQLEVATHTPRLGSVSQTAWMAQPQRVDDLLSPPKDLEPQAPGRSEPDFFNDPFGDEPNSARTPDPTPAPAAPPAKPDVDDIDAGFLFPPNESAPAPEAAGHANDLRDPFGFPKAQPDEPSIAPAPRDQSGPSLGEIMRQSTPEKTREDAALDSPSDQRVQELPAPRSQGESESPQQTDFDNPFPRPSAEDAADADARDRERLERLRRREEREGGFGGIGPFAEDDALTTPAGISCDDFRDRIAFQTIDKISLDISPPYRPDEIDAQRYERLKAEFDERQSIRQWRNIAGVPLASGRLVDLAYEKALIETDFGTTEELPINKLSEADLAYISKNWGLPGECLIQQVAYTPRAWTPLTMTWKASNLCHTPLYFQDVNLERYGHTHGPVLEPLVQTAHFFGNIAVLPYKMGVHAPDECQYTLGYYRPGNCAPWIVPPVPLSLRGALYQGAAVTGLFWFFP